MVNISIKLHLCIAYNSNSNLPESQVVSCHHKATRHTISTRATHELHITFPLWGVKNILGTETCIITCRSLTLGSSRCERGMQRQSYNEHKCYCE